MKRGKRTWIWDLTAALGWCAVAVGVGMLSLPAGIITGGLGLLAAGVLGALTGGEHAE